MTDCIETGCNKDSQLRSSEVLALISNSGSRLHDFTRGVFAPRCFLMLGLLGLRKGFVSNSSPRVLGTVASPCIPDQDLSPFPRLCNKMRTLIKA